MKKSLRKFNGWMLPSQDLRLFKAGNDDGSGGESSGSGNTGGEGSGSGTTRGGDPVLQAG